MPADSALCAPSCELGTCGKAGSCSIGSAFSKRSTRPEVSFNTSSDYEDTHALRRRLFTNSAGSTTYSGGDVNPKRGELDAYIPAVDDHGAENHYFGPPLATVEMNGKSMTYAGCIANLSRLCCLRHLSSGTSLYARAHANSMLPV